MSKAKAKEEAVQKTPEVAVQVAVPAAASDRRVSFEQWAARRQIKATHLRGMRAFVANPDRPRTMAEWDAVFKAY